MESQCPSPAALPEPPQLPRFPFAQSSQLHLQPGLTPEGWKSRKRSSAGWWCPSPSLAAPPTPGSSKVPKALTRIRTSSAMLLLQKFPTQRVKGSIKHPWPWGNRFGFLLPTGARGFVQRGFFQPQQSLGKKFHVLPGNIPNEQRTGNLWDHCPKCQSPQG